MGLVGGNEITMNSTRVEWAGFLVGPLYYVWKITEQYYLKEEGITMHVDNPSVFNNCDPPRPGEGALRHLCDDYDLKKLKEICEELYNKHNIKVTWQHMKAHQDQNRKKDKHGNLIPLTQDASPQYRL